MQAALSLGVSACLMGQPVRYDGTDRRNGYVFGHLSDFCLLSHYCPEVAAGLGVPRPPIQLRQGGQGVEVVMVHDPDQSVTAELDWACFRAEGLLTEIDGFIGKSRSPSCAVADATLFAQDGTSQSCDGYLVAHLRRCDRLLPVISDEQIVDTEERLRFFEMAIVHSWWRTQSPLPGAVFETLMRLSLLARGQRLQFANDESAETLAVRLAAALSQGITPQGHSRVLRLLQDEMAQRLPLNILDELAGLASAFEDGRLSRIQSLFALVELLEGQGLEDYLQLPYLLCARLGTY